MMYAYNNEIRCLGFLDFEKRGIYFLQQCAHDTNQISAKFILRQIINRQRKHLSQIDNEVKYLDRKQAWADIFRLDPFRQLSEAYDTMTLNFIEAFEIAMRLTELQSEIYRQACLQLAEVNPQTICRQILKAKKVHFHELKNEYERINLK